MTTTWLRSDYDLALLLLELNCSDTQEVVRCVNELLENEGRPGYWLERCGDWLAPWRIDKSLKLSKFLKENYLHQEATMNQVTGDQVLELIYRGNFGLAELFYRTLSGSVWWDAQEATWKRTQTGQPLPDYAVMAELMRTLGSRAEATMDLLPIAECKKQLGKLASTLWSATAAEHGLFLARAFLCADGPGTGGTDGTLFLC